MTIEELQLAPVAKEAAEKLQAKYPHLVFTSGRRTVPQQARAMAANIVKTGNRQWIAQTYLAGAKLQQWVNNHPNTVSLEVIANGLERVLLNMSEGERLKISRHLTGHAFDVQPVTKDAAAIKNFIRQLPGLHKFLEREGGAIRWHAQF